MTLIVVLLTCMVSHLACWIRYIYLCGLASYNIFAHAVGIWQMTHDITITIPTPSGEML